MEARHSQSFRSQLQQDLISFTTHEGQEYIVAPCVAIVPGVLNRALVPLSAIKDTVQAWNGRPIVVNHPQDDDGTAISANEPSVIESQAIGQIWFSNTEDERLKVQAWVNTEKAKALGGESLEILNRLNAKESIEVSTGYWAVTHENEGLFNGEKYDEVTDLIIPDHLAFLPHAVGACDWGDGCGVPRVNTVEVSKMEIQSEDKPDRGVILRQAQEQLSLAISLFDETPEPIRTAMTMTDTFAILASLIAREMEAESIELWRWHIIDIEDDSVIIAFDGHLQRRAFTVDDNDDIELNGEWEEVNRKTTFTSAEGKTCACLLPQEQETPSMEPIEQVDTLVEFLQANSVSEADIMAALASRQDRRSADMESILAHHEIDRVELEAMSDKALRAWANSSLAVNHGDEVITEAAPPVEADPQSNFVGRGRPVRVARTEKVPPRPNLFSQAS